MGSLFDWVFKDNKDEAKLINDLRLTIKYLNECIASEQQTVKELAELNRSKQKHIDKLYEDMFDLEHQLSINKDYIKYLESNEKIEKVGSILIGFGLGIFLTSLLVIFGIVV